MQLKLPHGKPPKNSAGLRAPSPTLRRRNASRRPGGAVAVISSFSAHGLLAGALVVAQGLVEANAEPEPPVPIPVSMIVLVDSLGEGEGFGNGGGAPPTLQAPQDEPSPDAFDAFDNEWQASQAEVPTGAAEILESESDPDSRPEELLPPPERVLEPIADREPTLETPPPLADLPLEPGRDREPAPTPPPLPDPSFEPQPEPEPPQAEAEPSPPPLPQLALESEPAPAPLLAEPSPDPEPELEPPSEPEPVPPSLPKPSSKPELEADPEPLANSEMEPEQSEPESLAEPEPSAELRPEPLPEPEPETTTPEPEFESTLLERTEEPEFPTPGRRPEPPPRFESPNVDQASVRIDPPRSEPVSRTLPEALSDTGLTTLSEPTAPVRAGGTQVPTGGTHSGASGTSPAQAGGPGVNNPAPSYPRAARRRGEEGTVHLRVTVSPDGRAQAVTVAASSGFPLLDSAAADAVRSWRFQPALQNGVPVAASLDVPIVFRLTDR